MILLHGKPERTKLLQHWEYVVEYVFCEKFTDLESAKICDKVKITRNVYLHLIDLINCRKDIVFV